jgi:tetrahydrodipicolinate N-succinyltransferase
MYWWYPVFLFVALAIVIVIGIRMSTPLGQLLLVGAASSVIGLLLGAAAVFGITLMVQQDTKPPLQAGDPASSVLNRVEYGERT